MGLYSQLTREERYQIEVLLKSGFGIREIGRKLQRSASSISREVQRNPEYEAHLAHRRAMSLKRAERPRQRKITGSLERFVVRKIQARWSPEQIAGRIEWESHRRVLSHQTIYRYIERDHGSGGSLWLYLRILRWRKSKNPKRSRWRKMRPYAIAERRMIDRRPSIVEKRNRLGDFERDTVLGKHNGEVLLTLVDRTSRLLKMSWLKDKQCDRIHKATVALLQNEPVKTITNDNGIEFARHRKTEKALKAKIYFSRAYRAWERGTNENTNGLLRQYFPRKESLARWSKGRVKRVEQQLNSRPRKCLGYQTPLEVHKRLKRQVLHF